VSLRERFALFGMLVVDWDRCKKVSPLYRSAKRKVFILTQKFFVPYFEKPLYPPLIESGA
jgi:hypothetical protein